MKNVVIVDAIRMPIGTMGRSLKDIEVDYLAANVLKGIIEQTELN